MDAVDNGREVMRATKYQEKRDGEENQTIGSE